MTVTGIVLAAGGSTRLGRPKQLLEYRGAPLLAAVLRVARECRFDQVLVALGGGAAEVEAAVDLSGVEVVHNPDFGSGCASTISRALDEVDPHARGIVLMLGDQPGVGSATVAALLDAATPDASAVCRYRDGRGHPLWFGRSIFPELRMLHGDKGVWTLLESGRIPVLEVPVDAAIPLDVDTWDDYVALRAQDSR
ncbi:nucleotidyltransferase family protein [Rhodococcus daqingensis]|uniref:NTP transferase domain-containing protein n=1 Tax=Rhodococcus daqingensis TaxID=2479363 RepID=A0ABW2RXS1_9NOCA